MRKLIVCLFLALAVPVMAQAPPTTDEATASITQLREGLITSFNKGDIDGLLSYLDPNVVVTWQNGEVCRGPGEVRAFYQRMMSGDNRVVREMKCEPEVVGRHIYGDWAVSWGNLHDHFVLNDGSDLPFNSCFYGNDCEAGRSMVCGRISYLGQRISKSRAVAGGTPDWIVAGPRRRRRGIDIGARPFASVCG